MSVARFNFNNFNLSWSAFVTFYKYRLHIFISTKKLISLRLNTQVKTINSAENSISIGDETLSYDHLALTTGSTPRLLPAAIGGRLDGVFAVRSLADVDAMQPAFGRGGHVLIIGGGYIGLEAAAVAAARGLKVTLVEMVDRI